MTSTHTTGPVPEGLKCDLNGHVERVKQLVRHAAEVVEDIQPAWDAFDAIDFGTAEALAAAMDQSGCSEVYDLLVLVTVLCRELVEGDLAEAHLTTLRARYAELLVCDNRTPVTS